MGDPELVPGLITTREEMAKLLGGGQGQGIQPSQKTRSVLIYSDPEAGQQSGYYDGWLSEEDERGPVFEYTGHGEKDQTFLGRDGVGNRAILQHAAEGRVLHVFKAVGLARDFPHLNVPRSSKTKAQRYIGRFELDVERPYEMRMRENREGELRKVIVFRLRPIDCLTPGEEDKIPPANKTEALAVPADAAAGALVEPEANKKTTSFRSSIEGTRVERREAKLSADFQAFLEGQRHQVKRFQIRVKGSSSTLLTDLYDVTAHVLYEAKGTSSREDVRMAIGQLLDYRRHVNPADPKLAVLLPEKPHEDLQDLLRRLDIAVVYQAGNSFAGWPVLGKQSPNT
ncbi:hypothetical protein [Thermostaphylospora chromogena]|uniref:ScoMcrA-like SRA domain-containing protein n=1 Tax=Thermostaphylospora chromogena TaxID=35622 RepID=A0A1H1BI07_9ACTN|nr:hypothetical protein [Thermostaphylospora chromogena]SDQ51608.1 hypothetical protein SAMN04489764_0978 [Thermostaphylospora chromogena]